MGAVEEVRGAGGGLEEARKPGRLEKKSPRVSPFLDSKVEMSRRRSEIQKKIFVFNISFVFVFPLSIMIK